MKPLKGIFPTLAVSFIFVAPCLCLFLFLYYGIRDGNRSRLIGMLCQSQSVVENWYDQHNSFPEFFDEDGKELWSWRVAVPVFTSGTDFDVSQPWNSPVNLKKIASASDYEGLFRGGLGSGTNEHARIVAVKGAGTLWTETNAGRVKNPRKYKDMILLVMTTESKNFWAEPGDDISPEDVIRLYEADPGLLKNSKRSWLSHDWWPKYFATLDAMSTSFADIKDVEELKRRLVIPEHELPERPTEPE